MSQAGQDAWIKNTFHGMINGYFVDIGAFDGVSFSNSYYLEKELGWKGICVEPGKSAYIRLLSQRNSLNYNMAVSDFDGPCSFNENGQQGGLVTTGPKNTQCITVETLLRLAKAPELIQYMSIDVEGAELEVLKKIPFDTHTVIALTVEHNAYLDGGILKKATQEFLEQRNYQAVHEAYTLVGERQEHFETWFINKNYL